MCRFLRDAPEVEDLSSAVSLALSAWSVGRLRGDSVETSGILPAPETITANLDENRAHATVEAAVLERTIRGGGSIAYRILSDQELNSLQKKGAG